MSDLNAAILAYLIFDHDKTLSESEVIELSKRVLWACDEFDLGLKTGLEYVMANPQFGIEE